MRSGREKPVAGLQRVLVGILAVFLIASCLVGCAVGFYCRVGMTQDVTAEVEISSHPDPETVHAAADAAGKAIVP